MINEPLRLTEEKLREKLEPFPQEFQEIVLAYRRAPSPELLGKIVTGILEYNGGDLFREQRAQKGGAVRLVEDVNLDSLSLVELSFQAEEFLGVIIKLEDFPKIRTLDELQGFLRAKAFPPAAPTA